MRSVTARLSAGVVYACVFFAVAAGGIGVVGIVAVGSATSSGIAVTSDELATASDTARFSQQLDVVYSAGLTLSLTAESPRRERLATELYDRQVPAADSALATLQRAHADDGPAELAGIRQLGRQWTALRNLLTPATAAAPTPDPVLAARLTAAYQPVSRHVAAEIHRENSDGRDERTARLRDQQPNPEGHRRRHRRGHADRGRSGLVRDPAAATRVRARPGPDRVR